MKEYTFGNVVRASAWGILIGGVVGFSLGLLIAPEEGKKIRRRVAFHLDNMASQIGSFVDQSMSPLPGSKARQTGDALVADVKAKAQRISDDIDALLGDARRSISSKPSKPSKPTG